jgi:1,4-alpha-glucan branching enzyme
MHRISAILAGDDYNPFSFLGLHKDEESGALVVRAFLPGAARVVVLHRETGEKLAELLRTHDAGFFAGPITSASGRPPYRLRATYGATEIELDDPYSFGPLLGELDLYLHAEGSYLRAFEKMGAHPIVMDGISGTSFAVWAPNARRVSVVGDFNGWDGRRHSMRLHPGAGIWEIFLPGVASGARYKYEIKARNGALLLKADPFAFAAEPPPLTASVVSSGVSPRREEAGPRADRHAPVSIYEVHLGSWQRVPEEGHRPLNYRELADRLIPYAKEMGFTHLELMPINEHPFTGSWGYQPTALFAPTSRYGTPDEFREFVKRCHAEGIGLILDWAAGHFPDDPHGLTWFDGTHLYEHADPKEGYHPDWKSYIYNFGRNEVRG